MFFWNRKPYIYPGNYNSLTSDLFSVCQLEKQSINFVEVCNVDGKQLCLKRNAVMKSLLSNSKGDLFFEGRCKELGKDRIFELILNEYEIDGVNRHFGNWFIEVAGKSIHMHKQECARRNAMKLWEGYSDLIQFTDVFSEVENGSAVQRVVKRSVHAIKILIDSDCHFYLESLDLRDNSHIISYMADVDLEVGGKKYTFESWCKTFADFSPDSYLSNAEHA